MCSVLSLNLCRSAGKALLGKGHFGWFDSDVTFEVRGRGAAEARYGCNASVTRALGLEGRGWQSLASAVPGSCCSRLPTCPPAHLPTCPPAHLPTCPPAHLPTCPPACCLASLQPTACLPPLTTAPHYPRPTPAQVGLEISSHILAVAPAALIGLVSGLAAICFTIVNLRVARLRDALMARLSGRWKRLVEPCVIVVVYVTGCMLLPLFSPCTPTECFSYKVGAAGAGAAGGGGGCWRPRRVAQPGCAAPTRPPCPAPPLFPAGPGVLRRQRQQHAGRRRAPGHAAGGAAHLHMLCAGGAGGGRRGRGRGGPAARQRLPCLRHHMPPLGPALAHSTEPQDRG
jgi:hypothetical protein